MAKTKKKVSKTKKAKSSKKTARKPSQKKVNKKYTAAPTEEREALQPEIIEEPTPQNEDFDADTTEESSTALAPTDPLSKYMLEIRKYPLLSKEEELRLAKLYYDHGDKSAAETLVTSNLRFVVKVAAEYSKFGAKLIDLIQEGNVGLMHAVREFNPYKGVRLITYAVWWIRGYIQEFLMRQYSMVRIGTTANQRKLFYQLQKEREELERMGYDKGIALLSGRLGIPEEEVKTMHQRLSGRDLSLDQPFTSNESGSLMDFQTDTTEGELEESLGTQEELSILQENLEALRSDLNEKELYLLDHRLLSDEPKTLQEIGDEFGVTREAVRQMEVRLMKKIKDQIAANLDLDRD